MADSGFWVRGRIVVLDGRNDDDKMRALARETFRGSIEDTHVVGLPDPALRAPASPGRAWMKWSPGVGAAAMLTAGASLLYLHQTCGPSTDPCRNETPTFAYASLGVGVALGVVATYLLFSDRAAVRAPSMSLRPTSGGALVGLSVAY
jgi:hypothetical protein